MIMRHFKNLNCRLFSLVSKYKDFTLMVLSSGFGILKTFVIIIWRLKYLKPRLFCSNKKYQVFFFILSIIGFGIQITIQSSKLGGGGEIETLDNQNNVLPERIQLKEGNNSDYFTPRKNTKIVGCYTAGSIQPEPGSRWPCVCQKGYYGPNCAIPDLVMTSVCQSFNNCEGIRARSKPRRIIRFFNFHHELDHTEVQLGELADVVDVFVIAESNRTTSGEPNELLLLPKMRDEGFLKEYHSKIIYVMIPSTEFPDDPKGNGGGWLTDAFIRNYMGEEGLARIDGLDEDDLVVLTDADEFINKDVLQFLKLHDGFPEPVRVNYRVSEYAYYWKRKHADPVTGIEIHFDQRKGNIACTIGMLRKVYDNKLMLLRRLYSDPTSTIAKKLQKIRKQTVEYVKDGKHRVSDKFIIGRLETDYAAYHCTWCFRPEGIRAKWIGRNKNEFVDMGTNKDKINLKNITAGLKRGNIFGSPDVGLYQVNPAYEGDLNFAPGYVWKNKEKFAYLLFPEAS